MMAAILLLSTNTLKVISYVCHWKKSKHLFPFVNLLSLLPSLGVILIHKSAKGVNLVTSRNLSTASGTFSGIIMSTSPGE